MFMRDLGCVWCSRFLDVDRLRLMDDCFQGSVRVIGRLQLRLEPRPEAKVSRRYTVSRVFGQGAADATRNVADGVRFPRGGATRRICRLLFKDTSASSLSPRSRGTVYFLLVGFSKLDTAHGVTHQLRLIVIRY